MRSAIAVTCVNSNVAAFGTTSQAICRYEDQLTATSQAHALRISEIQDTFVNKIQELRRLHQEQLAENEAAAALTAKAQQEELANLRAKLLQVEAQAEAHAAAKAGAASQQSGGQAVERQLKELQNKVSSAEAAREQALKDASALKQQNAQLQQQVDAAKGQEQKVQKEQQELQAQPNQLKTADGDNQQQISSLRQQVAAASSSSSAQPPPPPTPPSMDTGMLQMMEMQLGRLSEMVRAKDAEIEQLATAVQLGIDERHQMMAELQVLRDRDQQGSRSKQTTGRPAAVAPGRTKR